MACGEKKVILDEEVFAVMISITVIASVIGFAVVVFPRDGESFVAMGTLNENCRLGGYPTQVVMGSNITLCIFIYNHLGKPVVYQVVYKIGLDSSQLPTNTSPSIAEPLKLWRGILEHGRNITFYVSVHIPYDNRLLNRNASLIFELWILNSEKEAWSYSGRWNHLWVRIVG